MVLIRRLSLASRTLVSGVSKVDNMLAELYLIVVATLLCVYATKTTTKKETSTASKTKTNKPPTPSKLPLIGHLHLLAGYKVPYQAFNNLSQKFGSVFGLQLGKVKAVVVNEYKNIKEVLITKGNHFDSRPDFQRYRQLFSGNKENSLAFCDWSNTQKIRRDMLKIHTFPKSYATNFTSLENHVTSGVETLIDAIKADEDFAVKMPVLKVCANIFANHFCTKNFLFDDTDFERMVDDYDEVFYEVNQGYAADFLPFLMPLHKNNLKRIKECTEEIRNFVIENLIGKRRNLNEEEIDENDYVDGLLKMVKKNNGELNWEEALFALEDIIGGHSAVGNFFVKLLAFLSKEPEVQEKIQQEIDQRIGNGGRLVTLSDRNNLPYTDAAIFEAIRLIASPIVPRVANCDSTINGYDIEKGTVIFLNNYDLSMSPKLWDEPEKFKPDRFVRNGHIVKPEHFLPFGGGRRSCMGYKMVQLVCFGLLAGLLQTYTVLPADQNMEIPIGSLALPKDTFRFKFIKRNS